MNREEFLDKLRRALSSTGSQSLISENVEYYKSYIHEELKKGRSESEILEELGDPKLLARSIKDAAGFSDDFIKSEKEDMEQENESREYRSRAEQESFGGFRFINLSRTQLIIGAVILLLILGGILWLLGVIVGGILNFLAPVLGPLILVGMVVYFVQNMKKR